LWADIDVPSIGAPISFTFTGTFTFT